MKTNFKKSRTTGRGAAFTAFKLIVLLHWFERETRNDPFRRVRERLLSSQFCCIDFSWERSETPFFNFRRDRERLLNR